jgi:eukaryotic-like serine/threonine-protein kinase
MAGPQTLGRYRIERVLGKGAMGVVYEALDPKLKRKVAIKTIQISQLDEETAKDFSMRFVREAEAVARLNHPNIVQVYDFGEEGGVAYLVMEFIRGKELKSSLTGNQPVDREQCVRIMCELLDALDFAHDAGVIHRDIKPANVMLDSQGRTKLTDFGVARVTDADRTNAERTQAGTMVGTPAYMSPEQVQGHKVDRRTDIFSAGIILYQFLTGQKPFVGEGAWTVAKKIILEEPPVPSSLNVGVSPEFDRVVAKALAKNPDQRFGTARDFAGALRRASEGKPAFEGEETTVVAPRESQTLTQAPPPPTPAQGSQSRTSGEMELEFWRSIKDSEDPHDFELYVRQFPQGVYASLAARKVARLRGLPGAEESGTRSAERTADGTRLHRGVPRAESDSKAMHETGTRTRPVVDRTMKVAPSPAAEPEPAPAGNKSPMFIAAILALLAVAGAAAYFFVIKPSPPAATAPGIAAEEKAKSEAAEKARRAAEAQAEAQAKQEAEAKAKAQHEAEATAQREAELRAKRDAEAKAQRDAELQARREAELRAKAEAELQATRNAAAKAKREAELRAQTAAEARAAQEAEAKAKREAEAQAKREAQAQAKREAQAQAKREADAKAQREAEAKASLASEASLWDSIKASSQPEDFQKYLSLYPKGKNAGQARKRVAALEKARLDEQRRIEREKAAAESAAQRTEAEKKNAEKRKSAIVVPTF